MSSLSLFLVFFFFLEIFGRSKARNVRNILFFKYLKEEKIMYGGRYTESF